VSVPGDPISVLYVDDEPTLLDITKIYLEHNGEFSIDTATSARRAIGMLTERQYDAIISDFYMPEMNGIEFLKKVRISGNTIPFIIFTGRGREEVVIQALNEGADFYLQKGGEPKSQFAELSHKVRQSVQQRRAETSIRDLERRETDIINFLPDATFAIDTHGVVIAWNRAMEQMTGIRAAEILGRGDYAYAVPFFGERRPTLIDLILHDDAKTGANYPFIIREGKKLISETIIPHFNNGKGAYIWFIASPFYDTKGAINGAIESIRDVTELRMTKHDLDVSREMIRDFADMIPVVIYEMDKTGVITFVNNEGFDLFGVTREDYLERKIFVPDYIVPADRDRAMHDISGILAGEKGTGHEYLLKRKDGSTFPGLIYGGPVIDPETKEITGMRGVIIDLTPGKRWRKHFTRPRSS